LIAGDPTRRFTPAALNTTFAAASGPSRHHYRAAGVDPELPFRAVPADGRLDREAAIRSGKRYGSSQTASPNSHPRGTTLAPRELCCIRVLDEPLK
jgi:hypothetical protein